MQKLQNKDKAFLKKNTNFMELTRNFHLNTIHFHLALHRRGGWHPPENDWLQ